MSHDWLAWLVRRIDPYSAGVDFRRQSLTSEVDPRTGRVNIFLIAVDPYHRYANESERAN